jgi:hypothetical protein
MVARAIDASAGDEKVAVQWLQQRLKSSPKEYQSIYSEALSGFDNLKPQSALYKVDLPDEQIARMLDWDRPLSGQGELIEELAKKVFSNEPRFDPKYARGLDMYHKMNSGGEKIVNPLAAQAMKNAGIPGIRYLDEGSRNAGKGTSNFVVFPGNEGLLKILERNGAPIK